MSELFLIVSMNKKAALFLKDALDRVFKGKIEIASYSFIDNSDVSLKKLLSKKPKLVMATGFTSYNKILEYYPAANCLLASRDISAPEYFDKLFAIPKNEKVLVVNETQNGAIETINTINNLGITHLTYIPYWANCNMVVADIQTAISPGMLYYCPASIKNRVDIGMRNLSTTTFIKILNVYNLGLEHIDEYILNQKKILVDTYEKLSNEYLRSDKLRNAIQNIVNVLDEAIIAIDSKYNITTMNSAATQLLTLPTNSKRKQNIYTLFRDIPRNFFLTDASDSLIVNINNTQIYLTYIPVANNDTNMGILKLSKVQDIQKNEELVRKMVYQKSKGHIAKYTFDNILTECEVMEHLVQDAKVFSKTDSTILITGESGTGKELLAQSIHNHSTRANKPFIAVNFAALPHTLIESELFGYEEGAFTGAKKSGKKGLFELAHTGTIFLDEIGYASIDVQTRLLRVLEEREIMRLGDTKVIPVNIRVIAATNKNLKKMLSEEKFLADLYYRINVFQLHVPPLRTRKETLLKLISILMPKGSAQKTFSAEAEKYILNYAWNGNIRELKNMLEYSVQISKGKVIEVNDLPYDIKAYNLEINTKCPNETDAIFDKVSTFYDPEILRIILSILHENKNKIKINGRNNIISILKEKGFILSDRNLRTLLNHLAHYDLITPGKTKQGTTLSITGESFLEYLKNNVVKN